MNKKKVDSKNNKPETNKQPLPTKTEKAKTPGREEKVDKVLNTPTATSANLRNTTTADSSTSSVSTAAKDSHHQQGDAEEYNLDDLEEKSASLVNNHNNSNNKNETSIQGNDQQQAEGEMEFASKEKEFIDKEREFTDKVKQMGQIKSDPEGDQQNNPDDVKKLVVGDQEPSGSTSTNPGDGAVDHQSSITSATERLKMKGFVNVTEETQSVLSQQPTGTDPSKMTNNLHDSLTADPIKSVNNHSQVLGVGDVKGPLSPLTETERVDAKTMMLEGVDDKMIEGVDEKIKGDDSAKVKDEDLTKLKEGDTAKMMGGVDTKMPEGVDEKMKEEDNNMRSESSDTPSGDDKEDDPKENGQEDMMNLNENTDKMKDSFKVEQEGDDRKSKELDGMKKKKNKNNNNNKEFNPYGASTTDESPALNSLNSNGKDMKQNKGQGSKEEAPTPPQSELKHQVDPLATHELNKQQQKYHQNKQKQHQQQQLIQDLEDGGLVAATGLPEDRKEKATGKAGLVVAGLPELTKEGPGKIGEKDGLVSTGLSEDKPKEGPPEEAAGKAIEVNQDNISKIVSGELSLNNNPVADKAVEAGHRKPGKGQHQLMVMSENVSQLPSGVEPLQETSTANSNPATGENPNSKERAMLVTSLQQQQQQQQQDEITDEQGDGASTTVAGAQALPIRPGMAAHHVMLNESLTSSPTSGSALSLTAPSEDEQRQQQPDTIDMLETPTQLQQQDQQQLNILAAGQKSIVMPTTTASVAGGGVSAEPTIPETQSLAPEEGSITGQPTISSVDGSLRGTTTTAGQVVSTKSDLTQESEQQSEQEAAEEEEEEARITEEENNMQPDEPLDEAPDAKDTIIGGLNQTAFHNANPAESSNKNNNNKTFEVKEFTDSALDNQESMEAEQSMDTPENDEQPALESQSEDTTSMSLSNPTASAAVSYTHLTLPTILLV